LSDEPAILLPWHGFLHVVPRVIFDVAAFGPARYGPAVVMAVEWSLVALLAVFLASDRLADGIPDRRVRVGLALALPVLGTEVVGSALDADWYLAVFLAALPLARTGRYDPLWAILAGLSGPASIVAWPLFLQRRLWMLVAGCGLVQLAVFAASSREPVGIDILAAMIRVAPLLLLGGLALWSTPIPKRTLVAFGWVAMCLYIAGATSLGSAFAMWGDRYLFVLYVALALVAISGAINRCLTAAPLMGVLIASVVIAFRQPMPPNTDWSSNADCIGSQVRCRVPIYPASWSVDWTPDYAVPVVPWGWDPGSNTPLASTTIGQDLVALPGSWRER
jgi:hypothetical protein